VNHLDQTVPLWRKSSYSDGTGGECVEVAATPGHVLIRDSKNPDGPVLRLAPSAARSLLGRLQADSHR
jgi:hypothetical protein